MGLFSDWKSRVFGAAHPTEMPKARVCKLTEMKVEEISWKVF